MTGIFSISVLMCKAVCIKAMHRAATLILIIIVALLQYGYVSAQNKATDQNYQVRQILEDRGEVVIKFVRPSHPGMDFLTHILSIDRVIHDTIHAYANKEGFEKFLLLNVPYEVIHAPAVEISYKSAAGGGNWRTHYPPYSTYIAVMDSFAARYPGLCHLKNIGTTPNGHKLLVIKISGDNGFNAAKPSVLLTSSIHGDEPLGFVLLLRLIETLLGTYGTNAEITTLVDSVEIWINPLINPDGTYFISDSIITGATRFNANHVDLNRNFPDPVMGEHPDSYAWQTETMAMMNFMDSLHPVLCANFHGGSEVVNYPWDAFPQLHPDDAWYRYISRQWADTAHQYSYPGYMTALENGITNGYNWYQVYGGRQDYVNYFLHGREVTIELSDIKMPEESTLDNYWNYNYRSLLHYMEQVYTGMSGFISDSITGLPVNAMITFPGHDRDNSHVKSNSMNGYYCRLTQQGNYIVEISAPGYVRKQIPFKVETGNLTRTNVKLAPETQFLIYPNPFSDVLRITISNPGDELEIWFTDLSGRKAKRITKTVSAAGVQEIRAEGLAPGMYIIEITYGDLKTRETILKLPY